MKNIMTLPYLKSWYEKYHDQGNQVGIDHEPSGPAVCLSDFFDVGKFGLHHIWYTKFSVNVLSLAGMKEESFSKTMSELLF